MHAPTFHQPVDLECCLRAVHNFLFWLNTPFPLVENQLHVAPCNGLNMNDAAWIASIHDPFSKNSLAFLNSTLKRTLLKFLEDFFFFKGTLSRRGMLPVGESTIIRTRHDHYYHSMPVSNLECGRIKLTYNRLYDIMSLSSQNINRWGSGLQIITLTFYFWYQSLGLRFHRFTEQCCSPQHIWERERPQWELVYMLLKCCRLLLLTWRQYLPIQVVQYPRT